MLDPAASRLPLAGDCRVWTIDSTGFGVHKSQENLVLYCRGNDTKLVRFLQEKVLRGGRTGFVMGTRGSGKSTTSAAFALALARSSAWVVTWIHVKRGEAPICVRLEGNEKKTVQLQKPFIEDLILIVNEVDDTKEKFVFLDGYMEDDDDDSSARMVCNGWVRQKWDTRRVVVVTSTPYILKRKLEDDRSMRIEDFKLPSWTWSEYVEAIENEELFRAVESRLDASAKCTLTGTDSPNAWRKSLLQSKYYFAGGSARYMFGYSTAEVVSSLNEVVTTLFSIKSVDEVCCSAYVTNQLESYRRKSPLESGIISRYAGLALAMFGSPAMVKSRQNQFYQFTREVSNSDVQAEGFILEVYLFARIRKGGVTLFEGDKTIHWPQSEFFVVNPTHLPELPSSCWLKPLKYDQGAYDAVYVDKEQGLVRIVQVAQAHSHKFHIGYFSQFLDSLRDVKSFEVKTLEIFFVVEKGAMSDFEFSEVTGRLGEELGG